MYLATKVVRIPNGFNEYSILIMKIYKAKKYYIRFRWHRLATRWNPCGSNGLAADPRQALTVCKAGQLPSTITFELTPHTIQYGQHY